MGPAFLAAAALCLALGFHPFLTYPASLRLLARFRPRPLRPATGGAPNAAPKTALCVCAYNEETIIAEKAENMRAMRHAVPGLDLLVYVDAASDRTADILSRFGDDIRVVVGEQRHGKTHGMNRLVQSTEAEYVVFSDANVMFAPDAIPRLLQPFADPAVGCVCGHLIYTDSGDNNGTAALGSAYWRLEERIKDLESLTGSTMGADGSIFAIRRTLHRPPPPDIIDDMFVSLSILCGGHRVVRAPDALAYERTTSRPDEEFRRKIRIACQAFNVHRLLWPRLSALPLLDRYKYVSHKLLRWFAAYFLALAGLCAAAGLAWMGEWGLLAVAVACSVLPALGLAMQSGPIRKLADIALAFVATGLGVLRSLKGERFQVWTPPSSARGGS